jgi:hypothetical protein
MRCKMPSSVPIVLAVLVMGCGGGNYNAIMTKKITEALGKDFERYQTFSYPTNNFGLATTYLSSDSTSEMRDEDFYCDSWDCIGAATKIPDDPKAEREMLGYAAVGGNGAAITLDEKTGNQLALNVVLPEVYDVLKISGGFDEKKMIHTVLEIGQAYPRVLRRPQMEAYLRKLPPSDRRKKAFDQGTLVIVVADVIVDHMRVTIEVDQSVQAALDAALKSPVPQLKVGKGAQVNVKPSRETNGKYTFDVTRPVIISRLGKRQERGAVLLAPPSNDEWGDWKRVRLPAPSSLR